MERLCPPCNRYRNILESQGLDHPERLWELNLDVSPDDFLSAERAFTYSDLYDMMGNEDTIVVD
jgi:hypothetical protein